MDAPTRPKPTDTTAVGPTGVIVPPSSGPIGISPINRRRWQNFKSNRRGWWSFWIFLVLFIASLFAEFIANEFPG
jgi:microcin C transport system permease protein